MRNGTLAALAALVMAAATGCSSEEDEAGSSQPDAANVGGTQVPVGGENVPVGGAQPMGDPDAAVRPELDAFIAPDGDAFAGPQPDAFAGPEPDAFVAPEPDAFAGPEPDAFHGPVASCAEAPAGATECFSNDDCAAERTCRNVGTSDLPVPCCVPGARGNLPAGAPCEPATGEADCASSICIEGDTGAFCSAICADETDCPEGMRVCQPIAFSGSDESWCFPETPE